MCNNVNINTTDFVCLDWLNSSSFSPPPGKQMNVLGPNTNGNRITFSFHLILCNMSVEQFKQIQKSLFCDFLYLFYFAMNFQWAAQAGEVLFILPFDGNIKFVTAELTANANVSN